MGGFYSHVADTLRTDEQQVVAVRRSNIDDVVRAGSDLVALVETLELGTLNKTDAFEDSNGAVED